MSSNINRKKTVDFISKYAVDYMQLFKNGITNDELFDVLKERTTTLSDYCDELQLQIELLKAEAVQEYLLGRGANDEEVNATVFELRKKINQ